jgi:hypothetical protein
VTTAFRLGPVIWACSPHVPLKSHHESGLNLLGKVAANDGVIQALATLRVRAWSQGWVPVPTTLALASAGSSAATVAVGSLHLTKQRVQRAIV